MVARSFLSASLLACLALGAVGCGAAEPEDEALGVVDDAEDALTMVWPVVRSGQVNQDVTTVQYLLKAAGFTVSLDGSYGAGTETAV